MQRWEYKLVEVTVLYIGDIPKHGKPNRPLDPEITDWLSRTPLRPTWGDVQRQAVGRVAWSDRGCWTTFSKALEEVGEAGWELVGTTPPHVLPGGGSGSAYGPFFFVLKRPKT